MLVRSYAVGTSGCFVPLDEHAPKVEPRWCLHLPAVHRRYAKEHLVACVDSKLAWNCCCAAGCASQGPERGAGVAGRGPPAVHHGGHLALHVRRRPEDRGRLVPARAIGRRVLPEGAHTFLSLMRPCIPIHTRSYRLVRERHLGNSQILAGLGWAAGRLLLNSLGLCPAQCVKQGFS